MSKSPYGNLENLLVESHEQAYWLGFIFADGSVSDSGRLSIALAAKDEQHLHALKKFLGVTSPIAVRNGVASFNMSDSVTVRELGKKYGLYPRKTWTPPSGLPFKTKSMLLSFMVGFIDGDGYIRNQTGRSTCAISTVSDKSWERFLSELCIKSEWGDVTMRSGDDRYVEVYSYRHEENLRLKHHAQKFDLPVLYRKWDRVREDYKSSAQIRTEDHRKMILDGFTNREIMDKLGYNRSTVTNMRKSMGVDLKGRRK